MVARDWGGGGRSRQGGGRLAIEGIKGDGHALYFDSGGRSMTTCVYHT